MSQGLEVGALVSKSAERLCQKLKGRHSDGSIGQQHHLLPRNLIVQHKAIQGCLRRAAHSGSSEEQPNTGTLKNLTGNPGSVHKKMSEFFLSCEARTDGVVADLIADARLPATELVPVCVNIRN